MDESLTRIRGAIDRFCAGLNKDREYMESLADENGRKMQNQRATCMGEWVVEGLQTRFKAFNVTIKKYTSG